MNTIKKITEIYIAEYDNGVKAVINSRNLSCADYVQDKLPVWLDILSLSDDNPQLKIMLEKIELIYRLLSK